MKMEGDSRKNANFLLRFASEYMTYFKKWTILMNTYAKIIKIWAKKKEKILYNSCEWVYSVRDLKNNRRKGYVNEYSKIQSPCSTARAISAGV